MLSVARLPHPNAQRRRPRPAARPVLVPRGLPNAAKSSTGTHSRPQRACVPSSEPRPPGRGPPAADAAGTWSLRSRLGCRVRTRSLRSRLGCRPATIPSAWASPS